MRYTNNRNLPKPLADALIASAEKEHTSADYSVTELLKGSTETALSMLHYDELVMDVSELFNALFGSAVHSIVEPFGGQDAEVYMETETNGRTVSGTSDYIEDDTVIDWKACPSWKIIYNDTDDWRRQGKGYCYLNYKKTGKLLLKSKFYGMIKDWQISKAKRDKSYPQSPVAEIEFTYTADEVMAVPSEWENKIAEIENLIATQTFPPCTEEERWHEPDTWALMKAGRKSAVRLYDNEADAESAKTEKSMYVEHRVGRDKKCDDYCVVGRCGFCPYYNETHKEENENG